MVFEFLTLIQNMTGIFLEIFVQVFTNILKVRLTLKIFQALSGFKSFIYLFIMGLHRKLFTKRQKLYRYCDPVFFRIDVDTELPVGECELVSDFSGKIRTGLQGVYLNRQVYWRTVFWGARGRDFK